MTKTRKQGATGARLLPQREVVRDVMLSAAACDRWLTLLQLSRLTHYGEASISAQLRHLRKPEHGGYAVEKRVRRDEVIGPDWHGLVWEYKLRPEVRRVRPERTRRPVRRSVALQAVAS